MDRDQKDYDNLEQKIKEDLEGIKELEGTTVDDQSFGFWVAQLLGMKSEDAQIGIPGHEFGIDILRIDIEKKTIDISQVKWSDKLQHNLDSNVISKLFDGATLLYDEDIHGNKEFEKKKVLFRDAIDSGGYSINFQLVTAGKITDDQRTIANALRKSLPIDFRGNHISAITCYSVDNIFDMVYHPETPDIDLDCEEIMEYKNGSRRDVFAIIKGVELNKKLKQEDYMPLFQYNPRFSLGTPEANTNINLGIIGTSTNPDDSENFLEYNNGITSVCVSIKVKNNSIHVKNLKVVNGCQTVVSLGDAGTDVEGNVMILCKFYEIPDDPLGTAGIGTVGEQ